MNLEGLQACGRQLLRMLFPALCTVCHSSLSDDPVPFFCRSCWVTIRPLKSPSCPRCGQPLASRAALRHSPSHLCGACRSRRPSFTKAWTLYAYEEPLQDAICLLKYRGKVSLKRPLGDLILQAWPPMGPIDLVMPVPLHPARLREREFNQALLLAAEISRQRRLPLSYNNLTRSRETPPQTGLTRAQRRRGLRRCFAVRWPTLLAGKRVLLVDDVYTTGTTVNECAKALRKAGSGDVFVLTLARTLSMPFGS